MNYEEMNLLELLQKNSRNKHLPNLRKPTSENAVEFCGKKQLTNSLALLTFNASNGFVNQDLYHTKQ